MPISVSKNFDGSNYMWPNYFNDGYWDIVHAEISQINTVQLSYPLSDKFSFSITTHAGVVNIVITY